MRIINVSDEHAGLLSPFLRNNSSTQICLHAA